MLSITSTATIPRVKSSLLSTSASTASMSTLTGRTNQNNHHRQTSIVTSPSTSNFDYIVVINTASTAASNHRGAESSVDTPLASSLLQLSPQQEIQIAEMGAAACWGLGDWDQMKKYVKYLPESTYEGSLYRSVLALTNTSSDEAADFAYTQHASYLIEQTRDLLDPDLTSMASQSYERSYQAIIEAQVLSELEEILTYKQVPSKRDWLVETWWKRLQGCERSLEYWHRLLLVRTGIVLPQEKDIKPWLKFSSLCQKAGHLSLSQQILSSLLRKIQSEPATAAANSNANSQTWVNANKNQAYLLARFTKSRAVRPVF